MELSASQRTELEREALRVYGRYQLEVVEALSLCPWAVKAREEGNVETRVTLENDEASVDAIVEELAANPEVHVGLVIMPTCVRTRAEHERFVALMRERHAKASGGSPPLAMAAFHPDAEPNLETPARLVPFIRRTPDPTVQLVRISVLEELRAPFSTGTGYIDLSRQNVLELMAQPQKKPLHERIAQSNLETVERVGVEKFRAKLEAIKKDRDEAYARIVSD